MWRQNMLLRHFWCFWSSTWLDYSTLVTAWIPKAWPLPTNHTTIVVHLFALGVQRQESWWRWQVLWLAQNQWCWSPQVAQVGQKVEALWSSGAANHCDFLCFFRRVHQQKYKRISIAKLFCGSWSFAVKRYVSTITSLSKRWNFKVALSKVRKLAFLCRRFGTSLFFCLKIFPRHQWKL